MRSRFQNMPDRRKIRLAANILEVLIENGCLEVSENEILDMVACDNPSAYRQIEALFSRQDWSETGLDLGTSFDVWIDYLCRLKNQKIQHTVLKLLILYVASVRSDFDGARVRRASLKVLDRREDDTRCSTLRRRKRE